MFDFKISINRYYKNRIDIILFYVIIVVAALTITRILHVFIILLFSIILFCVGILMYLKEKRQKFEVLSFFSTYLTIGNNPLAKIDYTKIQSITLSYKYTKSSSWLGGAYSPISIPSTGHENTIKIITENGGKTTKNIWCENDADYRRLKSLGGFLEEKGINVKMKGFEREIGRAHV